LIKGVSLGVVDLFLGSPPSSNEKLVDRPEQKERYSFLKKEAKRLLFSPIAQTANTQ